MSEYLAKLQFFFVDKNKIPLPRHIDDIFLRKLGLTFHKNWRQLA